MKYIKSCGNKLAIKSKSWQNNPRDPLNTRLRRNKKKQSKLAMKMRANEAYRALMEKVVTRVAGQATTCQINAIFMAAFTLTINKNTNDKW